MLASCSGSKEEAKPGFVDIATAVANLQQLKASDLGKTIEYVPLETSDSCLVGAEWAIYAFDDFVIIRNSAMVSTGGTMPNSSVMTFDINSGKYLHSIGHPGEDPEAYRTPYFSTNPDGSRIYFPGNLQDAIVEYDSKGKFIGTVYPFKSLNQDIISLQTVSDSIFYGLLTVPNMIDPAVTVYLANANATQLDSICIVAPEEREIKNPTSLVIQKYVGVIPHSGGSLIIDKKDGAPFYLVSVPYLWPLDNKVFATAQFSDTVFNITDGQRKASMIFNLGDKKFTCPDFGRREINDDELFLENLVDSRSKAILSVRRGWFENTDEAFIGVYDKENGTTVMTEAKNGFKDDLSGFMPFYPVKVTPDGKWVGVITMQEIETWLEKNPDAKLPDAVAEALEKDDEPNPILVIVK